MSHSFFPFFGRYGSSETEDGVSHAHALLVRQRVGFVDEAEIA